MSDEQRNWLKSVPRITATGECFQTFFGLAVWFQCGGKDDISPFLLIAASCMIGSGLAGLARIALAKSDGNTKG